MFLTGINNQRDRDARTADYYNSLKKRIQLNTNYEEAVNANVDRTLSGITKPPPPEENIDKELNDLNLQKQKAFENIKTVLTKNDEAIKFLGKLDDAEIVPFNRYFSKFKNSTTGVEVKDADFLLKLWDSFKKKTLLTDKETPILGTDLENYKNELQTKADDILNYANEMGFDSSRIRGVLDQMVSDSDSTAIDKFYYNLLTKGIPGARMVLDKEFGSKELPFTKEELEELEAGLPSGERPSLTEEEMGFLTKPQLETRLSQLSKMKEMLINPTMALVYRTKPYIQKLIIGGDRITPRILDITKPEDQDIIKRHLPEYANKIEDINREINKVLIAMGSSGRMAFDDFIKDLILDEDIQNLLPYGTATGKEELTSLTSEEGKMEEKEEMPTELEKLAISRKKGLDFNSLSNGEFNNLIQLQEANAKTIKDYILTLHPDGKFEVNKVKYNLNRNPPLLNKQKEYLLKPLYDSYGIKVSADTLFKRLLDSERYKDVKANREAQVQYEKEIREEEEAKKAPLKKLVKKNKEIQEKKFNESQRRDYLDSLQIEAKKIAEEVFTQQQLFLNKNINPIIENIKNKLEDASYKSGFTDVKLNDDDIRNALKKDVGQSVINLMRLVVVPFEKDLERIERTDQELNALMERKYNTIDSIDKAKLRTKLGEIDAEIKTKENFLSKNEKFYEDTTRAINKLQSNLGAVSEYFDSVRKQNEDEIDRGQKKLAELTDPLQEEYDDIREKLQDEGINIPDLGRAVNEVTRTNIPPPSKAPKKPKRVVNVPKVKLAKKVNPKKGVSLKEARRQQQEEEEEEYLRGEYQQPDEPEEEKKAGSGIHRERKTFSKLKKIQFGKYAISGRALGSGILDIRTHCDRTTAKLGRTPISSRLEKAITYVLKNDDIDIDSFDALTSDEKKLFLYAIEISEVKLNSIPFAIFKKFNGNDFSKELDQLIDRYHVLVGELGAGNNAPEILRELRGIIFKLLEKKKIDKVYANELLLMINAVA